MMSAEAALALLDKAKEVRGVDWGLHSSWCSGQLLVIGRVRRATKGSGKSRTGTISEVLSWMAEEAWR